MSWKRFIIIIIIIIIVVIIIIIIALKTALDSMTRSHISVSNLHVQAQNLYRCLKKPKV